jgi:DNA-binding transcriptional ArsR family regulator
MSEIPPDLRPKTYAASELFLDMMYWVGKLADTDLESLAILVCVTEATMRPVLGNADLVERIATVEVAPEEARGSITMLLIADRLGLPRETVRRKVKKLTASGLVYEDEEGRMRTSSKLGEPEVQRVIEGIHTAVGRYRDRLSAFGIPG